MRTCNEFSWRVSLGSPTQTKEFALRRKKTLPLSRHGQMLNHSDSSSYHMSETHLPSSKASSKMGVSLTSQNLVVRLFLTAYNCVLQYGYYLSRKHVRGYLHAARIIFKIVAFGYYCVILSIYSWWSKNVSLLFGALCHFRVIITSSTSASSKPVPSRSPQNRLKFVLGLTRFCPYSSPLPKRWIPVPHSGQKWGIQHIHRSVAWWLSCLVVTDMPVTSLILPLIGASFYLIVGTIACLSLAKNLSGLESMCSGREDWFPWPGSSLLPTSFHEFAKDLPYILSNVHIYYFYSCSDNNSFWLFSIIECYYVEYLGNTDRALAE